MMIMVMMMVVSDRAVYVCRRRRDWCGQKTVGGKKRPRYAAEWNRLREGPGPVASALCRLVVVTATEDRGTGRSHDAANGRRPIRAREHSPRTSTRRTALASWKSCLNNTQHYHPVPPNEHAHKCSIHVYYICTFVDGALPLSAIGRRVGVCVITHAYAHVRVCACMCVVRVNNVWCVCV